MPSLETDTRMKLPLEVFQQIISKLVFDEQKTARFVSKKWARECEAIVLKRVHNYIELEKLMDFHHFVQMYNRGQHIRTLRIDLDVFSNNWDYSSTYWFNESEHQKDQPRKLERVLHSFKMYHGNGPLLLAGALRYIPGLNAIVLHESPRNTRQSSGQSWQATVPQNLNATIEEVGTFQLFFTLHALRLVQDKVHIKHLKIHHEAPGEKFQPFGFSIRFMKFLQPVWSTLESFHLWREDQTEIGFWLTTLPLALAALPLLKKLTLSLGQIREWDEGPVDFKHMFKHCHWKYLDTLYVSYFQLKDQDVATFCERHRHCLKTLIIEGGQYTEQRIFRSFIVNLRASSHGLENFFLAGIIWWEDVLGYGGGADFTWLYYSDQFDCLRDPWSRSEVAEKTAASRQIGEYVTRVRDELPARIGTIEEGQANR